MYIYIYINQQEVSKVGTKSSQLSSLRFDKAWTKLTKFKDALTNLLSAQKQKNQHQVALMSKHCTLCNNNNNNNLQVHNQSINQSRDVECNAKQKPFGLFSTFEGFLSGIPRWLSVWWGAFVGRSLTSWAQVNACRYGLKCRWRMDFNEWYKVCLLCGWVVETSLRGWIER